MVLRRGHGRKLGSTKGSLNTHGCWARGAGGLGTHHGICVGRANGQADHQSREEVKEKAVSQKTGIFLVSLSPLSSWNSLRDSHTVCGTAAYLVRLDPESKGATAQTRNGNTQANKLPPTVGSGTVT